MKGERDPPPPPMDTPSVPKDSERRDVKSVRGTDDEFEAVMPNLKDFEPETISPPATPSQTLVAPNPSRRQRRRSSMELAQVKDVRSEERRVGKES